MEKRGGWRALGETGRDEAPRESCGVGGWGLHFVLYSSNLNPHGHADTLAKRLVKRGLMPSGTNASIATEP